MFRVTLGCAIPGAVRRTSSARATCAPRVPIVVFVAMDGGVTNVGIAVSTWSVEVQHALS
tara:strand:- start:317 stop:496 length:180 start_codon:yes stop_codon:yes gene_type:complete